jgi:hypothetical protein
METAQSYGSQGHRQRQKSVQEMDEDELAMAVDRFRTLAVAYSQGRTPR